MNGREMKLNKKKTICPDLERTPNLVVEISPRYHNNCRI